MDTVNAILEVLRRCRREVLRARVPPEHAAGFARAIAYTNWLHGLCLTAAVFVVNLGVGLVPELFYYRSGLWPVDSAHLMLTSLHGFMAATSVAAGILLLRDRPRSQHEAEARHGRLALGYAVTMLAAVTVFSAIEQALTGSISAYLLGVAVFATMLHTRARFCLAVLALTYAALVLASLALSFSPVTWHHLIVAFDAVVIFWIGSRIGFAHKADNYLQLVTITEQSRALAEANAQLARAERFKGDLLALAGHDLRDPLNTISLSAQTLRDEFSGVSDVQTSVAVIDDSVRHMDRFLRNLLVDAESEAGAIELDRHPVDLPPLVAGVVDRSRAPASAKSITLQLTVDDSARAAPPAFVDPARIRQVLENLLGNAIKFSPPGRRVWVELSHDAAAGGHRLVVRDEGPGVRPEDRPRLFSRFQRLAARPTGGETSSGLGLFIANNLVTLHGGRISAESDGPGQGTRFIVILP